MPMILGLDLGKLKSLACLHDTGTTAARFATVPTDPAGLRELMQAERPGLVVFQTCTVAGWVAALCLDRDFPDAAARIYAQALAAGPERARPRPDPRRLAEGRAYVRDSDPPRYEAARDAALAGTERGRDAPRPASPSGQNSAPRRWPTSERSGPRGSGSWVSVFRRTPCTVW